MIRRNIGRIAIFTTALLLAIPSRLTARQWSDRTTLTLSAPVKVPGATLPAGTYTFELVDPRSSSHVVKITDTASANVIALTHAVPTKRAEATEHVVLLFSPTDQSAIPAIRGWYPAGGRHGHLFVYSEVEARSLAERTKSVVLSRAVEDSRSDAGTIVVIRPDGETTPWFQDSEIERDWDAWLRSQPEGRADRESVTPMIAERPQGQPANVDQIEDHPERYFGRTVNVDGKVGDV